MTQMEKVLNGIEEVRNSGIQCPLENVEPHRCFHFPEELIDDIVSLLKAQEPRVMSMEELQTAEECMEPVFVEMLDGKGKPGDTPDLFSWRFVRHITPATDGKIYMLMNYGFNSALWAETYNATWRCWTSRPTDEQRKAVKWE